MIIRTVLSLWLVLFLYSGGLKGQVYSDRKVRKFKATDKTAVEIRNKYGKIHVITWDKDSVRFEADLRISANNQQKLDKMRNNISFEFTATKYYIVGQTVFSNQSGIISDLVDAFIPSNQVSINYMVYIPHYIRLTIENKFGDVYMDDFNGELDIELSNGDLKANKLAGNPMLRLNSSDGNINTIKNGKIIASYSDIEIREANNLQIESKSSRITIDNSGSLEVDSKRDKYEIRQVAEISGSAYFSALNIDELKRELRFSSKYGDVEVGHVSPKFSFINIESEYADIDLYFDRSTAYNLDISHHKDVYVNLPASLAKIETKVLNSGEKMMLTYGKIGAKSTDTLQKVNINALRKCYINIIHR